jgi:hypothetical protein
VDEKTGKKKEPVVAISQRAWPLIDMLERTSKGGPKQILSGKRRLISKVDVQPG